MEKDRRNYIWLNGQFFPSNQPVLDADNRLFVYGDGVLETIHAYGTEGRHLTLHYERLIRGMKMLNLDIPAYFSADFLAKEISRLLNKNRHYRSTAIRLSVYRNPSRDFIPANNTVSILMHSTPLDHDFYPYNTKGLIVDIYTEIKKPINVLSALETSNSLLYIMAGIFRDKFGVDDCLLINEQNRLVESISSNLFLIFGDQLYTPCLTEGCKDGIVRQLLVGKAAEWGYKIYPRAQIDADMLVKADEVFITDAISGIRWIVGVRHKRYFNKVSRELSLLLNRHTFPNQFSDGLMG